MIDLEDSVYQKLCELVYEYSGLSFDERKKYFVTRRVEQRMDEVGANSSSEYYNLVRYSNGRAELAQLTETLTTNETYFFREYPLLQAFADDILPEMLEDRRKRNCRKLRVWSAGCSTGDEPYTLAIILRELIEDLARWDIEITATDISREALEFARRAVYTERAVKDVPTAYRSKYFTGVAGGYQVAPCVSHMVQFRHGNLLDRTPAREMDVQDFVFCRNMLIYFDDVSRRKVVDHLYDALATGGYIFLGHSESMGRITSAFRLVRRGNMLVYVK